MKVLFKLLLLLGIGLAGIYASTPLWLPFVVARQMPPDWHLENMESGYPGLSGIDIQSLHVKGALPVAGLAITADDIHFQYRSRKTDIGTLSLDVFMPAIEDRPAGAFTLDDLSLPVLELSGNLPELSVSRMHLALHHVTGTGSANPESAQALVLDFAALKLEPGEDNSFHIDTDIKIQEFSTVNGRVKVDVTPDGMEAGIRFPADVDSPPWLDARIDQQHQGVNTTTRIEAVFDTEAASREWLDLILTRSTGGRLTHADGALDIRLGFSGQHQQDIEHLSLLAKTLQIETHRGLLDLDVEMHSDREGEKVRVSLPTDAIFKFQDRSGWFDELFTLAIPELERVSRPEADSLLVVKAGSRLIFQNDTNPSTQFNGDFNFKLTAADETLGLQATGVQFEPGLEWHLESSTATGLLTVNWTENTPFAFASTGLDLSAEQLSLAGTGNFRIIEQAINFETTADFKAQFKNLHSRLPSGQSLRSKQVVMQGRAGFNQSMSAPDKPPDFSFNGPVNITRAVIDLPGDDQSPAMKVTAGNLSIQAELTSHDGKLFSTGNGSLIDTHITPPATSASRIDLTWEELDLINLAGSLGTSTQGFSTEIEGEKWSGFNFDVAYTLAGGADVNGSGTLRFDNGPDMPIEFAGNTQTGHWDMTLPATTVRLPQLRRVLKTGHVELPAALKLTDGYIDLQGSVVINDDITAKMTINGNEMGASLLESSVRNASFAFDTEYGANVTANGPLAIETVALAGGVEIAHVKADLALEDTQTFNLKNLYAEVFDGQINLGNLRFSNTGIEDTTAELIHINLGRLLAFADIDGLQGTGTLMFSLPLGSDQNGMHVKNGTFSATGPGYIAYKKGGMASGNIGLQALQNFQYQVLSGTLDYQSHGDYQIAVHLEGKNPDLYGGHPIVFNLKINGSLPELFEAMFITGDFDEMILKQIKVK